MHNLNVVFMGTPEFACPILEALITNTNVVLVVTQPDKEKGRKKELVPSPIKEIALKNNIPVFQPSKIKTDYEEIKKYHPDIIITCAYGQIVPVEVLNIPPLGCINVHASLLPKYRGGAPIHHAILNGEKETGITIMYMDIGMDTGDIIDIAKIPILDTDNLETMHNKLSVLGANLLLKVLPTIINGTAKRIKQNESLATYAKIIKREDEHLDFNNSATAINNHVRALNSWPLANLILNNKEIKVISGYIGKETEETPGKIVDITKDSIGIACLDKIYYITKIKPTGKNIMLVKDYLNGLKKDELLGTIVR